MFTTVIVRKKEKIAAIRKIKVRIHATVTYKYIKNSVHISGHIT